MKHERECFYTGERDDDEWRDAEDCPCICPDIIEAYSRGRHDAAEDVLKLWKSRKFDLEPNDAEIIAAIRWGEV